MTEKRQHLVALTLTGGILGILIGAGGAVWIAAARNEPPRAAAPSPTEAAASPTGDPPVVASGVIAGDRWRIQVSQHEPTGWCLIVTRGAGTSSYCSFDGEEELDIHQGLGLEFGTVTKKAFFVEAKGANRRRMPARIVETPPRLALPFNIVVALPGPSQVGDSWIRVFNKYGNKIKMAGDV
jgi:hypothetical protein